MAEKNKIKVADAEARAVCERIQYLIDSHKSSYGKVAEQTGIPKSAVHRYATGETTKIPVERIKLIAKAFCVSEGWLMGWEETSTSRAVRIPVYAAIPAGIPLEAIEDIIDWEEIAPDMAKQGDFFALRVKGDSMEPRIKDGDVVIVRCQSAVDNGALAVVMVNSSDATLKRFYRTDTGVKLVSSNPKYDPFFYTPAEVDALPIRVIGKVVELRAKFL